MSLAGALLPWIDGRFLKIGDNGLEPNSGGFVQFYTAGTTTPEPTYTTNDVDPDTGVPQENPVELDADGRPPSPIFLSNATGYDIIVYDADMAELYSLEGVENVAEVVLATLGSYQDEGSKGVTSGYTVLATDRLVTVDSTGGADPCLVNLPPADEATQLLTIKNLGTIDVSVVVDGTDTLDSLNAAYTLDAAASPNFPSIMLVSDGISAWTILASHGL